MPREHFPNYRDGILFNDRQEWQSYTSEVDVVGPLGPFRNDTYSDGLEPSSKKPKPSPSATPGKLMSLEVAAKYSGLSTKRIRHLVNSEQVRCVRHSKARNGHIKVVRASLDEWIENQSR